MKAFVSTALVVFLCAASTPDTGISYGPDSIVDGNAYASYAEPSIDVSPKDPTKLIAGSMVFTASGIDIEAFRSGDGGYSWKGALLPVGAGAVEGDVQAAYGPDGYAYMTALGSQPTPAGAAKNGLYVFGSSDNGETFRRLGFFQTPGGHSYDHEQLAIDRTHGRYRNRVYMTLLYSLQPPPKQVNGLGMIWSSDGGHTFHGPTLVSSGWSFNSRPVVLSDGTVLFPLFHTASLGDTKEAMQVARSSDGGSTFTTPQVVGDRVIYGTDDMMKKLQSGDYTFDGDSVAQFAAGRAPGDKVDSVYGIWSDTRTGPSRLLFIKSSDGGRHWTTQQTLFATGDASDSQYQPTIAVNADGVVGVSWYSGSFSRNSVAEMFAVSRDGGQTFSTPVAISSGTAPLKTPAGDQYQTLAFGTPKGQFISFVAPGARFPSGGDYMGMGVDARGAFHPVWIDARGGTNQVWNATIFPRAAAPPPGGLARHDVTSKLEVEFGQGSWDAASKTVTVPMRLHNASRDVLYPPFTMTVVGTKNPYYPDAKSVVTVLNAENGQTGVGGTFTFSAATLGNLGRLVPGADTASKTLKVQLATGTAAQPVVLTTIDALTATP